MNDDTPTQRATRDDEPTTRGLAAGQEVFGRYRLESIAGRGGMGVVWRATDLELGETVALKFLPEVVAGDAVALDELKAETRHSRRLTHPHIVRIHDFLRDDKLAAVSMEFVDGTTLAQLRLAQPGKIFSTEALGPLVVQLCAALDYAHLTGKVVHRDLKPANLLVTRDGQLKVTDFGIARSLTETATRLTGTVAGTSGTLLYMSPQQLKGRKATPADDLYSLGATLYELLTSKPPFYTGDITHQILVEPPPSLTVRRAELDSAGEAIPPAWEKTIHALLAKEPLDRPKSAGDVVASLGLSAGAATPLPRQISKSPFNLLTSRKSFYGGLIAAGIIAGLAAFFWPKSKVERVAPNTLSSASPSSVPSTAAPAALAREFTVKVDPPDAGARIWLGPQSDMAASAGRAVLKDLPDGEQELIVQAAGYQPFTTRVTVKDGRGHAEVQLVPLKGALEVTARPGTVVTAIDGRNHATQIGTVPVDGVLTSENLLTIGTYTLRFEHPDCAPAVQNGVVLFAGRKTKTTPVQTPVPNEAPLASHDAAILMHSSGTVPTRPKSIPGELQSPTNQPTIKEFQARVLPDLGLLLTPIPSGTFAMGSTNGEADEKPLTQVTFTKPYWLGTTEVTQKQWAAIMMGSTPSGFKGADRPVEYVSWEEAMAFCQKLTERERRAGRLPEGYAYTLPTEAQWEYACRAGTTGDYAGDLDAMAWYQPNIRETHSVGVKQANPWGLLDMHGNVWEWCLDWYGNYPGGSVADPTGPALGTAHVIRGGGWNSAPNDCRSATRASRPPAVCASDLGFRLALTPTR